VAVHKSTVLLLRCQDWSESSQVVHLLAREVGRLRCLAKGSRRGQNPFSGPLDRWTLGEAVFSLTDPNRLTTLMELFETERFDGVRRRLPAFYGASLVTEIVLTLVPDAESQPATFDLVVHALRLLADVEPEACRAVALAAAWRLLALLGYVPAMNRCVECERPLEAGKPVDWNAASGGPVCPEHRPPAGSHRLTAKAAEAIAFLLAAEWDEVRRVRLTEATAGQIRTVLAARVEELAGKRLSALRYV
jgi:DNA repair protein RecO